MGDRANVFVTGWGGETGVYLYTHWDGTDLPETLRSALQRGQGRWDDVQYLARIIFCEMVAGLERELTGYGISSRVGDGESRILEVNVDSQVVVIRVEGKEPKAMPFQEYIAAERSWSG